MLKDHMPELDNRKLLESWGLYRVRKNQENELRFFLELKRASFLVPVKQGEQHSDDVRIMLLKTPEEAFIPAFTDREELEKWPFAKEAVAVIGYDGIKQHVLEAAPAIRGIAVNPFGGNLILRQKELELVDSKTERSSMAMEERRGAMKIFRPKEYPEGLVEAVQRFCQGEAAIHRIYALSAQGAPDETPHWLFLLDFDGEKSVVFPKAAQVIKDYMEPNSSFELAKAAEDFAANTADKVMPIYEEGAVPIG